MRAEPGDVCLHAGIMLWRPDMSASRRGVWACNLRLPSFPLFLPCACHRVRKLFGKRKTPAEIHRAGARLRAKHRMPAPEVTTARRLLKGPQDPALLKSHA